MTSSAGRLRSKIAFDARRRVNPDGGLDLGNTRSVFDEQFVAAAEIKPKLGGETVTAARLTGQNTVTITVRQNERTRRITPEWQARDVREEVTYAIQSVIDPDGDGTWIEILAQTGAAS